MRPSSGHWHSQMNINSDKFKVNNNLLVYQQRVWRLYTVFEYVFLNGNIGLTSFLNSHHLNLSVAHNVFDIALTTIAYLDSLTLWLPKLLWVTI